MPDDQEGQGTGQEGSGGGQSGSEGSTSTEPQNGQQGGSGGPGGGAEPETFTREYVETLRKESAEYRTRAKRADDLHLRLLASAIREGATGILEDPEDVWSGHEADDFTDDEGLPSVEKVKAAAQELAKAKPHLARRRVAGSVDQGAQSETAQVSLASMLRQRAG